MRCGARADTWVCPYKRPYAAIPHAAAPAPRLAAGAGRPLSFHFLVSPMSILSYLSATTLLLFSLAFPLFGQQTEFGILAGVNSYYGDLNPRYDVRTPGGGMNLLLRRNYDGRICLKGTVGYAYLWGSDARSREEYFRARNLSFFSHTFHGSVQIEFNFQPFHAANNAGIKEKNTSPYLATGLAVELFNPRAMLLGGVYNLREMGTEGQPLGSEYKGVAPSWLLGGGIKTKLSRNWSLNIELMGHLLFTDYLDDVSGKYADFSIIEGHHGTAAARLADRSLEVGDSPFGSAGRQRGNTTDKDAYMSLHIGLVYRFLTLSCPAY